MMRCETCHHECSVMDFVCLRNVCEHLYLDSVAQKQGLTWSGGVPQFGRTSPRLEVSPRGKRRRGTSGELVALKK